MDPSRVKDHMVVQEPLYLPRLLSETLLPDTTVDVMGGAGVGAGGVLDRPSWGPRQAVAGDDRITPLPTTILPT